VLRRLSMTNVEDALTFRQVAGLEISQTPDGWVIYRQETDRVHFLNPTAVLIFELCNGRHTVMEMGTILSTAFASPAPMTDKVCVCVSRLVDQGLVTPCLSSQSEP
jgi:Coenzyme PQQ synthesis protein D (PqqD)